MSFPMWFRSPRIRRGVAVSAVVLAAGGLVLYRTPASGFTGDPFTRPALVNGKHSATFAGAGAHGVVSLSHSHILSSGETSMFADVRLVADDARTRELKRAPIALAVVLDTSGSMSGEKIEEARRAVLRLVGEMRDDDEIALVRYSDRSEVLSPLARVGTVRHVLASILPRLTASGGTNIPAGLSEGVRALDDSSRARVRRIVVVSDGIDNTRRQAEELCRTSFSNGITVSSLGIGLDFDESYMGSLAQNGHGNFGFVKDGASLATFLHRELEETAGTTIENARVKLQLPTGVRFVAATGADAVVNGSEVDLAIGSLFAGDERRIVVELSADGQTTGGGAGIDTQATWNQVGADTPTSARAPRLTLVATADPSEVEGGKDGAVLASATSVLTSRRQVEAASAYARGDVAGAAKISEANEHALAAAIAAAPAPAASSLDTQMKAYREMRKGFNNMAPSSASGRAAAKAGVERDMGNLSRSKF